jgi:hypothetical protein
MLFFAQENSIFALPFGAHGLQNTQFGVWLSPVEYLVWDQGVAGSNPAAPTNF